ncbi:MAG: glycosyltransferase [Chromatiaceae bacterium]|nr:glycosyltransferase [Chromatiaceae bacterium]
MKVVLLSGASSIHTIRWANGLAESGVNVHLISQHPLLEPVDSRVTVHLLPFRGNLGYFLMVPAVKKLLNEIKPDLVNAHYASGYATTARLANYHPWLLSVWGSDVYDFPYKSWLHKKLVQANLKAADKVASTSHCMAAQTKRLLPALSNIAITPFGVDMSRFDQCYVPLEQKADTDIVIGTVKVLAPKYGIDTLLQAFALVRQQLQQSQPELAARLKLRIVGDGPQKAELEALAQHLAISDVTCFVGRVAHTEVANELAKLDIYVALSRLDSESFGVAIIEAGAAGRPVVVSDAGGLPEVVVNGSTGLVVKREAPEQAAEAILSLVTDRQRRLALAEAGYQHVRQHYDWQDSVKIMTSLYRQMLG